MKLLLLILLGCSSLEMAPKRDHGRFFYQLQKYDNNFFAAIKASRNATWVIDSHKDNTQEFTPYEILQFKKNGNQVLSYLSLGEAENYREYFDKIPQRIILYENKNWKGNYIVKYWSEEWHNTVYKKRDSLLQSIITTGFDGIFLDVVDVYKRFDNKEFAAKAMAELIIKISKKAKKQNPNFLVNIQNGFDIIGDLSKKLKADFLSAVDGISVEAHYFNYSKDETVKNPWFKPLEKFIETYRAQKKAVYMIEYVSDPKLIQDVEAYCRQNNIRLLITTKELDGKF